MLEDFREKYETAQARAGIYRLLARLFASEIDAWLLAFLKENHESLTFFEPPADGHEEEWLQAQRVEYARLFLMNVFPYESVYTGPEVMLNTEETEQVRQFYQRYHFQPDEKSVFADHLATELEFMAFLAEREAQSWQVNQERQAYYFIQAQQEFLQEHLVDWIATFRLAVGRASLNEFYASLVDDTFSFISEDLGHLYKSLQPGLQPNAGVGTDLLQAQLSPTLLIEKTLRKIVHHLITPVEAGLYLSKADLFSLAQTMQLPASGGDRFDVLRSLFEAAGQYGVLEGLLEKLIALVEEERNNIFWLQLDYNQAKPIWQEWQHKLEVTLQLLEEMKQAVMANPEEVWTAE